MVWVYILEIADWAVMQPVWFDVFKTPQQG